MEFQSAESALLMLLFIGFASTNAKLKGEPVSVLPWKTFWATVTLFGCQHCAPALLAWRSVSSYCW